MRTLLNSGNDVFRASDTGAEEAARAIEEALVLKLGVAARVFVLGQDELAAVMDANPLVDVATDHSRLIVFLLTDAVQPGKLDELDGGDWGGEGLALGERAAYVWCPEGILDSAAAKAIGKLLGDGTTSRNWNTLVKLRALCGDT